MKQPFLQFDFEENQFTFTNPIEIITTTKFDEVEDSLTKIQQAVDNGYYVAGYLSYEVTYTFFNENINLKQSTLPLLWFGIFNSPIQHLTPPMTEHHYDVGNWTMLESKENYMDNFHHIMKKIKQHDVEQINYTTKFQSSFNGDSYSYYKRLKQAQSSNYNAYLQLEDVDILSISPELFFKMKHDYIYIKPMKGTIHRGKTSNEDDENKKWLQQSTKNKYENKLIVDLMENELAPIATIAGSSHTDLYNIETYPTVHQMTSSLKRKLHPNTTITKVIEALFPCGSISGVPKEKTIQLINELENDTRDVYCGAIGYITPTNEAIFNVPIRTVTIDKERQLASYRAGGAITKYSKPEEEYQEVLTKTKILSKQESDFKLLETIALIDGKYIVLEEHLARLAASATYFDIPISRDDVLEKIKAFANSHPSGSWRIRVTVSIAGKLHLDYSKMNALHSNTVSIANHPIDKEDIFHYHKTTNRSIYNRHQQPHVLDVILWNKNKEVTEFTIGNIVVEFDGTYYTPPIECGVLPGTYRNVLLTSGKIKEKIIHLSDLTSATNIWLINSVREWVKVILEKERD